MSAYYQPDPTHRRKLRRPHLTVADVDQPAWRASRLRSSPCGHVCGVGIVLGNRQLTLTWANAWCR